MLPSSYHHSYQTIQQILRDLQSHFKEPPSPPVALQHDVLQAQKFFQAELTTLHLDNLDGAIAPKIQSIQIEINKQLRLLSMDVLFLQTARQSATLHKRQEQMSERIELLLRYCQMVLEIEV